ncbi:MAG: DUF975 family protein [Flavobacteriaceae bacterium]
MIKANKELMRQARESLDGNWGMAVGTLLVYTLLIGSIQFIPFAGFLVAGPMAVGLSIFTLALSRKQAARLELIFDGFKNFVTALSAYLLMVVFVLLWMLLLIIPGIITALAYSQTFYILAEDNSIGAMDALTKSKEMMNGYK